MTCLLILNFTAVLVQLHYTGKMNALFWEVQLACVDTVTYPTMHVEHEP